MKPIYLKPGQTVAVVPLKDPKIDEWGGKRYIENPPFLPNEKCYVPETWCKSIVEGIIYKDGYDVPDAPRWRPAVTMPAKYARRFVTIISCEPVRVEDISEEDARASGVIDGGCLNCGENEPCGCDDPQPSPKDTFMYDWHKRHPGKEWAWLIRTEE